MNVYELIRRKRDRSRLSAEEIEWLVRGFTAGEVPDVQMAAWLMAVFVRGMGVEETAALTVAMMKSGETFDLSAIPGPKVDKHSTGGVGDKVSLVLAPLVAACGVKVPMVSGRSLGHTGGTLDKLESIPGFRTDLTPAEFQRNLETVGVAMMGQTASFCPADRKMYALRDVTATVDSIPLIAASIMSKKLAEGAEGLVLDVKTGGGAFMSQRAQAVRLARLMMTLGSRMGRKVVVLVTAMSQPLGRAVGNAVEVVESIEALKGRWPQDLEEVTLALGEEMLLLAGVADSRQQARRLLLRAVKEGRGLEKFRQMVTAQGGDARVVDDYGLMPAARVNEQVRSTGAGYVNGIDALAVGMLGVELGTGRQKVGSKVDHAAGFLIEKKVGDRVTRGDVLATVLGGDGGAVRTAAERLARVFQLSATRPAGTEVVLGRIGARGNGRV